MQRLNLAIVLTLAALLTIGCSTGDTGDRGKNGNPAQIVLRPGDFAIPEAIEHWVEALRGVEGVYVRRDGDLQYVLVAMGERPTGGYQVELNDVIETADYILLEVVYRTPGAGDLVSQALTYPCLVVAVRSGKDVQVNRLDEKGEAVPLLVYRHEAAEGSGLIVLDAPVPFQGAASTVRLAGRAKTGLPVFAYAEDGHHVLLEETRLELSAVGDGWMRFDQELALRGSSSPHAILVVGFGTGDGRVETVVPLRMVEWSYGNK